MSLAWLKKILGGAKAQEDGTIDTDALSSEIEAELPKHTVPKSDFEKAIQERDEAQTQVVNLKGSDIAQLKAELEKEKEGRLNDKRNSTLKSVLNDANVIDPDYILFKLGDTSSLFDGENIKDKEGLIETIKKDYPSQIKPAMGGYAPPAGTGNRQQAKPHDLEEAIEAYYNEQ